MNQRLRRVAVSLLLGTLAACEAIWGTPEGRARDFIEALVVSPAEARKLRETANVSDTQNPEALIGDVAARVGLDYLRAQQAQGVSLKFVRGETRTLDEARRLVGVQVSYLQPGTLATGEVRFVALVEQDGPGRWRVVRVTGEN